MTDTAIVGGGPAGAAAAIALRVAGVPVMVIERSRETGDAICGGFLSWRTLAALERLGIQRPELTGHRVTTLRLFAARKSFQSALPRPALGVSRHHLDTLLLARAGALGAVVERGVRVRGIDPEGAANLIRLDDGANIESRAVFLATGKYELASHRRDPPDQQRRDPVVGLRLRIPPSSQLVATLSGAIELHLFDRGYAGLVLHEDGSANLCMAVRKSLLAEADADPRRLIPRLGNSNPALGDRLAYADWSKPIDAIAAVPYGWRASQTTRGQFRIGDQAGVIASLAGEGMGIALASARSAVEAFMSDGPQASMRFQERFARRLRSPMAVADLAWRAGEHPGTARIGLAGLGFAPWLAPIIARATRVA